MKIIVERGDESMTLEFPDDLDYDYMIVKFQLIMKFLTFTDNMIEEMK